MAVVGVVLAATSNGYGYHRDELYFRMLEPAWGYVDQPPFTPLVARVFSTVVADAPWAIRIPAVLCVVASILLVTLISRELGGGRGAQALCAWGYGTSTTPLVFGHVLLTSTVDLVIWPAVILLIMRALLRDEPRWWLAVGAVTGLSLYNKLLIVMPLMAVGVGLLAVGPRRVFRSPWLWAGVGLALAVGAPNLVYQVANGFPQVEMGAALAENNADDVRVDMWPFQLLAFGPPMAVIWAVGLVALARRPAWRPVRGFAVAYPVMLVLIFAAGTQPYYAAGLMTALFAAGAVATADWVVRAQGWRRPLVVAGVAVNAAVTSVIALPLLPVDVLGETPVPEINQIARDQVGWPAYVRQIAAVHAALPPGERVSAVVLTANYGEAGAVDRFGAEAGLPADIGVYSGQNQLWEYGPPPDTAATAVTVGIRLSHLRSLFTTCEPAATLDNGVGVENEEQGITVAVCREPRGGWPAIWPALRHLD
jgi:hypothetical protein